MFGDIDISVETLLGSSIALDNKEAVNQAIQFQIINTLLENSNRGGGKMSGMMLTGAFLSMVGTFFSVSLMMLATVNDVTLNGEVGIWGLIKGYDAMGFFNISIITVIFGVIIFGAGVFVKYKKEKQ